MAMACSTCSWVVGPTWNMKIMPMPVAAQLDLTPRAVGVAADGHALVLEVVVGVARLPGLDLGDALGRAEPHVVQRGGVSMGNTSPSGGGRSAGRLRPSDVIGHSQTPRPQQPMPRRSTEGTGRTAPDPRS